MLTIQKKFIKVCPMKGGKVSAKRVRSLRRAPAESAMDRKLKATTMQIIPEPVFDDSTPHPELTHMEVALPGKPSFSVPLAHKETLIGRGTECQIHIPLANVSRIHARINREQEEFVLLDMESTNGTFVNNIRIVRCVLHDNDQIRIGESRMTFIRQKSRPV